MHFMSLCIFIARDHREERTSKLDIKIVSSVVVNISMTRMGKSKYLNRYLQYDSTDHRRNTTEATACSAKYKTERKICLL